MNNVSGINFEFEAPVKDPNSKLRHEMDWRRLKWLQPGEVITSAQVFSNSPSLVVEQIAYTDDVVSWTVSGGVLKARYAVTCRIETNFDRRDDRTVLYEIGER